MNYIDVTFINSGTNLGSGEWVFAQVSGTGVWEFKSLVAGTGVTLSSSTNEITIESTGSTSLTTQTLAVPANSCATSTITSSGFLNAYANSATTVSPSVEIFPTGTIDPDNTSTGDNNIRNDNYTDLIYNNSSAGTANKSLPALDLWSSTPLWAVRIYWWNPQTYGVTNGKIQGSNNGTTWTDLSTGIVKTTGATGDFDDYTVTGSYRFVRLFSVTGLNGTWVTMSEIEAFGSGASSVDDVHVFNRNIQVNKVWGFVEFCNNEAVAHTLEISGIQ